MSYRRIDWCKALALKLGNSNPSNEVLTFLNGWTRIESSPPGAMYNLLNTEEHEPGSTNFNSVGVQNFVSFNQGISANASVIGAGWYPHILSYIKGGTGVTSFIDAELHKWEGNPTGYTLATLMSAGQTGMNDLFPGDMPSGSIPVDNDIVAKTEFNSVIHGEWWNSGIQQSWLGAYHASIYHGPALCAEYTINEKVYQHFPGSSAIWNKTNSSIEWRKNE